MKTLNMDYTNYIFNLQTKTGTGHYEKKLYDKTHSG